MSDVCQLASVPKFSDGDIRMGNLKRGKGTIRALNCWKPFSTNGQVAIDLGEGLLHQQVNIVAGQLIPIPGVGFDSSDLLEPRIFTFISIPFSPGDATAQNHLLSSSEDLLRYLVCHLTLHYKRLE